MKLKIIILLTLLATFCFADNKSQGYKIVLNTFPTLQEARERMDKIILSNHALELQEKYGFNIVSRSSGNSYIIAVEPIQDKQGVQEVLLHFKKVFKDAYQSGYYGPTSGSVFLTSTVVAEKNAPSSTKHSKQKSLSNTNTSKSEEVPWLLIALIGFPAAGAITGTLIGRFTRR